MVGDFHSPKAVSANAWAARTVWPDYNYALHPQPAVCHSLPMHDANFVQLLSPHN
jgi:hypothetical protein